MAFFAAAILSFAYFVLNRIKHFFSRMDWDRERYFEPNYHRQRALSNWQEREEPLFNEKERSFESIGSFRSIKVQ